MEERKGRERDGGERENERRTCGDRGGGEERGDRRVEGERKGTRKRGRRSQVNISLLKYSLEQFLGRWVGSTGWSSLFQCLNRDAGMCVCVGVYVLMCMRVYVLLCACVYVFVPVSGGVSAYATFSCV